MFATCLYLSIGYVYPQSDDPLITFGVIADTQYANCEPEGSRYYRNSLEKVEECVDYFNEQGVQFTVSLGDVTDRDFNDLDSVLMRLELLENDIYHITGNHDYKGVTNNRVLYTKLKMPSEYYFFKQENWVFIMLNTNEVAPYANVAGTKKEKQLSELLKEIKSSGGKQGAKWNGGISHKQLQWLDKRLAKCEKKGYNVLVFSHHPLYPSTEFTALNNMEILEVVGRYTCVKTIFAGHHHAGEFAYYKDIPVITIEGMIETPDSNSYGIVKLYDDKIVLEGKGRMKSRTFDLQ